jgi:hypothetical protein
MAASKMRGMFMKKKYSTPKIIELKVKKVDKVSYGPTPVCCGGSQRSGDCG